MEIAGPVQLEPPLVLHISGAQESRWKDSSPIREFLFFHKALRGELDILHQEALKLNHGHEKEIETLRQQYDFLHRVYKYHSSAEDEVILPALDARVKNVAHTYSLEHRVESDLFKEMSELLAAALHQKGIVRADLVRQFICCTEALQTILRQHLSKEEEQVFPLLTSLFDVEEQGLLVWQFMCSIPVGLMEECLPWMLSFLTPDERQEVLMHMQSIVPDEYLLKQVVATWLIHKNRPFPSLGLLQPAAEPIHPESNNEPGSHTDSFEVREGTGLPSNSQPCASSPRGDEHCTSDLEISSITAQGHTPVLTVNQKHPINELIHWHNAIRKELDDFSLEASHMGVTGKVSASDLASFAERYRFLADVCVFHSTAEDKVVFPAVKRKVAFPEWVSSQHEEEEAHFGDVGRLLEGAQHSILQGEYTDCLFGQLCSQAKAIVASVRSHLLEEEAVVLPLVRQHCSLEEQRCMVYQSLRVMPLRLLQRTLPWVMGSVTPEQAADMIKNMQLAAPAADSALVKLFSDWASRPSSIEAAESGFDWLNSCSVSRGSPPPASCRHSPKTDLKIEDNGSNEFVDNHPKKEMGYRNAKRQREGLFESEDLVPPSKERRFGDAANGKQMAAPPSPSLFHLDLSSKREALAVGKGGAHVGRGRLGRRKPIDTIFQFHRAIRKDLEYLSASSAKLCDSGDDELHQFTGRFHFLWGLYRAHSNAEDDIVFPELEKKKALENVSHSYTIDHKQEESLFEGIDCVLQELRALSGVFALFGTAGPPGEMTGSCEDDVLNMKDEDPGSNTEGILALETNSIASKGIKGAPEKWLHRRQLAERLHRMCASVRMSLDQHVSREEEELWPLFEGHFTIAEQDAIVGRIIGSTGAEVLQTMLPWITSALTDKEQSSLIDTWRQATRHTMFDQWLSAWWTNTSEDACPGKPTPPPPQKDDNEIMSSNESLKMVAEYFRGKVVASTKEEVIGQHDSVKQKIGDHLQLCASADTSSGDGQISVDAESKSGGVFLDSLNNTFSSCNCPPQISHQTIKEDCEPCALRAEAVDHGDETCKTEQKSITTQHEQESLPFRAGWEDIFRMNQNELEAAIRQVSSDSSLDPRRRAYLMQNLMTSRWIVAQMKNKSGAAEGSPDGSVAEDDCVPSFQDKAESIFGCEHYKRNCKLRAACCGQLFTCRFCHDKVSDHTMNRQATQEMMCMKCCQVQPVGPACATPSCDGLSMARYFCAICKLFDNDDREIYHCPFCNLCRVGKGLGIDYFHCMTCNACMALELQRHTCREKGLESNCPICHDFLFTSNTPVKALPCGHFMHSACFQAYTFDHYTCPICSKSLGDMAVYFGMLEGLLAAEELPEEFRNRQQDILCNDCEKRGSARFHWLYHKCSHCGSYNTRTV